MVFCLPSGANIDSEFAAALASGEELLMRMMARMMAIPVIAARQLVSNKMFWPVES